MNLQKIKKWTWIKNYLGDDFSNYYVFLSRTRDSFLLDQSNFDVGLKRLGGESETVKIIRNSHWLTGWIEFIAIHESDEERITQADAMLVELSNYPVLDEDDYSQKQNDAICEYWKNLSEQERKELLTEIKSQTKGKLIFGKQRLKDFLITEDELESEFIPDSVFYHIQDNEEFN